MKDNNFDVLRLAAALLVLVSHSFALTSVADPVATYFRFITGGGIAVLCFFFISGYLVGISAQRRTVSEFVTARILRVVPGLAAVVVFDVFIVGLLFTTLSIEQYFSHATTWRHFSNILVFQFSPKLPGVFSDLRFTSVNGSLWTLPLEASMYFLLTCMMIFRISGRIAMSCMAIGIFLAFVISGFYGLSQSDRGFHVIKAVQIYSLLNLGYFFFLGATFSSKGKAVPIRGDIACVAGVLLIACPYLPLSQTIFFITLPYLVYYAAFCPVKIVAPFKADISYGVYLFAFPVQQCIVQLFGKEIGPYGVIMLATPVVLALATLCRIVVENPALQLKRTSRPAQPAARIA
ncbi:acyltransferase [Phyllobacterium sp. SB3]|uniref:acyltransferase family protein n=1 Tax=Phyllobacterium sp. SB3 TaxID=3156073 RepID=UPI0032AF001E